jgi:glutathione S-transferase
MGRVTLYSTPGSCAVAAHIALELVAADYEAVQLDFSKNEQRSEAYLRTNPKGRVPALVTTQGVLTETPAVLQFIAQSHPTQAMASLSEPWQLAKACEFLSYLGSTVHVNYAHKTRPYRWADDEAAQAAMRAKAPQNVADCFALIEREMLRGPWVLGEQLSVCDAYLFTIAQWLPSAGIDIAVYPKVDRLVRALEEMPAVQRVMAAYRSMPAPVIIPERRMR